MIAAPTALPALPFPIFPDVSPEELAAEETTWRSPKDVLEGAWSDYLRRRLPRREAG